MHKILLHSVLNHSLFPPYPDHTAIALFGLGCFWGAEKRFWVLPGVYVTMVGYAGGDTINYGNPTYEQVCSGLTHHQEVVRIIYDPNQIHYNQLLKIFWESHDPTQGMRQGQDIGTQYRSGIYYFNSEQQLLAEKSKEIYQAELVRAKHSSSITTEILPEPIFYYAEEYHQQYLAKNPNGYCGAGGIGIACSIA